MIQWVNSGMRAQQVSQILTAVSDAITIRLIQLAEEQFGPAPIEKIEQFCRKLRSKNFTIPITGFSLSLLIFLFTVFAGLISQALLPCLGATLCYVP